MKADGFVRPREGAEFLGIGESTLWELTRREDFPKPIRIGCRVTLFQVEELRAWALAQRDAANDPGKVPKVKKAGRNA